MVNKPEKKKKKKKTFFLGRLTSHYIITLLKFSKNHHEAKIFKKNEVQKKCNAITLDNVMCCIYTAYFAHLYVDIIILHKI